MTGVVKSKLHAEPLKYYTTLDDLQIKLITTNGDIVPAKNETCVILSPAQLPMAQKEK